MVKSHIILPVSKPTEGSMGKTGLWRTFRPVINYDKCIKCLLCWFYCPDIAIKIRDDGYPEIDYRYCKGCGICWHECKVKAISFVREGEEVE